MYITHPLRKLTWVGTIASIIVVYLSSPAMAAKAVSGPFGNDVSYPQCGRRLPAGQSFGIVGINGGIASTDNSCFSQELAWAWQSLGNTGQPKAAVYVNTANPELAGSWWPDSNQVIDGSTTVSVPSQYNNGTCDGSDSRACAYVYGYSRAYEDATKRGLSSASGYNWWLDVETGNSWSTSDLVQNRADLEGMADYFAQHGATGVGVYSTLYQWRQIVGTTADTGSSLSGLPSWLAGARSYSDAQSFCTNPGLTPTSKVSVAQYVSGRYDYDVSCI